MRGLDRPLFVAILVALCPYTFARADGNPRSLDEVLARWEAASQKCRTLDATLTSFRYDNVFASDNPTITTGRFYFESPNRGRFELAGGGSSEAELYVWNDKEILSIDRRTRVCRRYLRPAPNDAETTQAKKPALGEKEPHISAIKEPPQSWLGSLLAPLVVLAVRIYEGPEAFLPLVGNIRAAEVKERYDLTLVPHGEEIRLTALPKRSDDRCLFRQIDVIIDGKTYLTSAIQLHSPNGKDSTVFMLGDIKVNEIPKDREELMKPKVQGYRMVEECPADYLHP